MELSQILAKCDHTLLAQTATWQEIQKLKAEMNDKLTLSAEESSKLTEHIAALQYERTEAFNVFRKYRRALFRYFICNKKSASVKP